MQIEGFQIYSFPMKPSIFYAIREIRLKHKNLLRPIVLSIELVLKEEKEVTVFQGSARRPNFLIKSVKADGFTNALLGSVVDILRKEVYNAPAGDNMDCCKQSLSDVASMFGAVPLAEGDIVARIPTIVVKKLRFRNNLGNELETNRAIFEMKPQSFGFFISTKEGIEEFINKVETKLKAGFQIF